MPDNPETYVSSAKQLHELNKKREEEALREETAANKAAQLENVKIALLKEANDLALKAHTEAQESKNESKKSSKRAFWSKDIWGQSKNSMIGLAVLSLNTGHLL